MSATELSKYVRLPEGEPSYNDGEEDFQLSEQEQLHKKMSRQGSHLAVHDLSVAEFSVISRSQSAIVQFPGLAFVEDCKFRAGIGFLIAFNILVMAGETDSPDFALWWFCENMFLSIFTVELALRVSYRGMHHFVMSDDWMWNLFDSLIVCIGVCELWFMPFLAVFMMDTPEGLDGPLSGTAESDMLRTLRLLRLLRLIRVFKIFTSLLKLVKALGDMMETFVVIFSILFFIILVCAIICTQMLGHAGALDQDVEHFEELFPLVQVNFPDVATSLFTLFQVTTTDNWMQIAEPVIALDPRWRAFFVLFILIASWTMISVLTAVASDGMVMATNDRQAAESREAEIKRKEFLQFLKDAFYECDADGSGTLDKAEFEDMISNPRIWTQIRTMGVAITREDFLEAWGLLDVDGVGELTIDEFVTGLAYLQEILSTKHIVDIEYSLKRVSLRTEKRTEKLKRFVTDMRTISEDVLGNLQAREASDNLQLRALHLWKDHVAKTDPGAFADFSEVLDRLQEAPPAEALRGPTNRNSLQVAARSPRPQVVADRRIPVYI